jgi:hypothetical protein
MITLKKNVAFLLLAGLLMSAPLAVRPARAAEDTELSKHMEQMKEAQKNLRKSIKDPAQNKASLDALTKFQEHTVASKALVPAKAAKLPEAEKAKFVAAYRKEMAGLLTHLAQIETAVLDNDNAKAEELFKGLKKVEDDGHEKFSEE